MGTSGHSTKPAEAADQRSRDHSAGRPDVATTVVLTMRQLAVAGLPRNYELFYEAITAGRRDLNEALSALGSRPTQKQLDDVARQFLKRDDSGGVQEAHDTIAAKLDEILGLLKKERNSMETYGRILDETSTGLNAIQPLSRELLDKIIGVTAAATKASIETRDRFTTSISDRSNELRDAKEKLEEYKRLADTDPLTQLSNRRAFDRVLSAIYDTNRGITFSALILADIDRFKSVNDRFGHPVGDRILQIVASILRSTVKEGAFVARTGGEEFAIVLEGCGEDQTFRIAEEVRQAILETPFVNMSSGINYGPITISMGTCMATQAQGPDDLYIKADRALYASKASGRNKTTRFSSLGDGNFIKNWLLYRRD